MSSLVDFAKRELDYCFPDKSDNLQQMAIRNVLELIQTFSNQGHSELSATYVLNLFHRLAFWKPIKPLTGRDEEWNKAYGEDNTQQNLRYSAVFRKNYDNATAFNSEGKVFIDKDGIGYITYSSHVPVTFPYEVPDKPEIVKASEN